MGSIISPAAPCIPKQIRTDQNRSFRFRTETVVNFGNLGDPNDLTPSPAQEHFDVFYLRLNQIIMGQLGEPYYFNLLKFSNDGVSIKKIY